jgi:primosomal protein N' (replication factor Y)
MRARVILSEPVGLLDYSIPEDLTASVRPGVPVRVPLGTRRTSAYVARLEPGAAPTGISLRPLDGLDPERPALPGDVLTAALPAMARRASARFCLSDAGRRAVDLPLGLHPPDRAAMQVARQFPNGFTVAALERPLRLTRRAAAARVRRLVDKGWLETTGRRRGARPRQVICYRRLSGPDLPEPSPRRKALHRLLAALPADDAVPAALLAKSHANAHSNLRELEAAGLVERVSSPQRLSPERGREPVVATGPPPEPTAEQASVLRDLRQALAGGSFATFLLHGVTGSGKTEVYLRVIEDALAAGRTALVLVPEIALTPQLGGLFRGRFGDLVATFHSGLTSGERRDEWERVLRGEARIGLGARSALFLPLRDLGVVIVDEEHETSFKQEETPRYHARDLAVFRGRQDNAVVVLGSATPSLESRANAQSRRYRRLVLAGRVCGRPMPQVELVDLTQEARVDSGIFSGRLADALQQTLGRGEQAILFLNRRGFAPYVYCRDCGHVCRCPDCDVSLTLHRHRELLLCHYCGFEAPAPDRCPGCNGHRMEAFGLGTERLEGELRRQLGDVGRGFSWARRW